MATDAVAADTTAAAVPEAGGPGSEALPQQVLTTRVAVGLIEKLRAKHGPVMFHQSSGFSGVFGGA